MWHYVEGITNFAPIWPRRGIRILPGPSSLRLDGNGQRVPAVLYPGADTLSQLAHLRGHDHSWFVLNKSIIRKEFALSGSEQNPDLTGRSWRLVARRAIGKQAPASAAAACMAIGRSRARFSGAACSRAVLRGGPRPAPSRQIVALGRQS